MEARPYRYGGGRAGARPSRAVAKRSRPGAGLVAVVALVLLVAFVSLVAWWLWPKGAEPLPEAPRRSAPKAVKEVKPSKVRQGIEGTKKESKTSAKATDPLEWKESFATNSALRLKFSALVSAQTNDSGVVTERYMMPNGQYWRRQIDPPPIFDNPSDNAIAMALGDRSGAPIPPYPGLYDANLDEEFAKSLSQPIAINEDDKPWLVALKTAVMEAREEIARQIKAGDRRTVGEMLRDHVQENNRKANLRGDALRGYSKVLETDGEEAAAEYLEKVNEALERFGVTPVKAISGERRRK